MREITWITLMLAILVLLVNAICQFDPTDVDYSSVPDLTYAEIMTEFSRLEVEVAKEPYSSVHRLQVSRDIRQLGWAMQKFEKSQVNWDPRIARTPRVDVVQLGVLDREFNMKYDSYIRSHLQEFEAARDSMPEMQLDLPHNPTNWPAVLRAIVLFQLVPIPFTLIIFAFRARDEGVRVWAEFTTNWRVPVYGFFWEFGLFRYSAEGFRERFVRAIRFACTVLVVALSFGTIKSKAAERDEEEAAPGGEHSLVISGGLSFVPQYLGLDGATFHPGPVFQKWLTVAHKSGVYGNLWHSNPVGGPDVNPNYGNETDLTIGYAKNIGKVSFDAGLTYFDVTPLFKGPQGDIFQPSLRVTIPLAKETKFGNVQGYVWLRSIVPARDALYDGTFVHTGIAQQAGLSKNWSVATSGEVVRDPGAFGFQKALIARWSAVLQRKVGQFTLELPNVQMSAPLTTVDDGRGFEQAIGVGLNFSFAH